MVLGSIHGNGTILGSITLAIAAVGQALAAVTMHRTCRSGDTFQVVDRVDHRTPREDALTQNIWLSGA
jgi:hypothetical protein